jgi:hypothetical protein
MKQKIFAIAAAVLMIMTVFTACSNGKTTSSAASPTPKTSASPSPNVSNNPEASPSVKPDASASAVELESFRDALKKEYGENYIPDRALTESEIEERTGLTTDLYSRVYAEASTLDESPDIFIAVQAKDGKTEEVKKCLEKYRETMLADNKYEANAERIKAAQVYSQDDHVFMVLLGTNEFGTDNQNIGESLKKEMQRGIDAIKRVFEK